MEASGRKGIWYKKHLKKEASGRRDVRETRSLNGKTFGSELKELIPRGNTAEGNKGNNQGWKQAGAGLKVESSVFRATIKELNPDIIQENVSV